MGRTSEYFARCNSDLLAVVPPGLGTVIEVGCGAGMLAERYRRANPGTHWIGIEPHAPAAIAAMDAGRVDEIFVEGIDQADAAVTAWPFRPSRLADCLIWGDVLEHLDDPWGYLRGTSKSWLGPGGLVLACVPNVQHYTVVESLLRGEWEYQAEGLMDRAHLRWFTLKSMKSMFKGAGLDIFEVRARNWGYDKAAFDAFKARVSGVDDWRPFQAAQFIIRAMKSGPAIAPMPPRLHIHGILGEACCARPRIHEPFAAIATVPGTRCTTHQFGEIKESTDRMPDIIIQQRARDVDISRQRLMLASGCKLFVAELDDHPAYLEGMERHDFLALRAVHAVQVSTEALADVVRAWNPHVATFPNQIADLPPRRDRGPDDGLAIFYGAQGREADWAPIMTALNRVLRDHRDVTVRVVHDRAFHDALETTDKTFTPFLPYGEYREALRACDIALLPLEDTEFNRCKSDIKALECFAEGVTVLASEVVYGPTVRGAEPRGLLYHGAAPFEVQLRGLVEDADLRHDLAMYGYAYVKGHRMLGQHYRARHAWYVDLLSRKAELDADLFGRVPGLKLAHAAAPS